MAAAASSSNSICSTNQSPLVKQEEPQYGSSEIMDSKEVKIEPMGDSSELKPMENSKELNEELKEGVGPIDITDSKEHIEKFKRYEAEFKQYLMSKYFSDKTIYGGNIFDVKMNIDGQTITASRAPPYQSYLDPATFNELISKEPGPSAENPTTGTSNVKPSS